MRNDEGFPTSTGLIQRKDSVPAASEGGKNQVSRQKQGPEVPGDGLGQAADMPPVAGE